MLVCSKTCDSKIESKSPTSMPKNSSGVYASSPRERQNSTDFWLWSTPTPFPSINARHRPIPQPTSSVRPNFSRRRFHRYGSGTNRFQPRPFMRCRRSVYHSPEVSASIRFQSARVRLLLQGPPRQGRPFANGGEAPQGTSPLLRVDLLEETRGRRAVQVPESGSYKQSRR